MAAINLFVFRFVFGYVNSVDREASRKEALIAHARLRMRDLTCVNACIFIVDLLRRLIYTLTHFTHTQKYTHKYTLTHLQTRLRKKD